MKKNEVSWWFWLRHTELWDIMYYAVSEMNFPCRGHDLKSQAQRAGISFVPDTKCSAPTLAWQPMENLCHVDLNDQTIPNPCEPWHRAIKGHQHGSVVINQGMVKPQTVERWAAELPDLSGDHCIEKRWSSFLCRMLGIWYIYIVIEGT